MFSQALNHLFYDDANALLYPPNGIMALYKFRIIISYY